MSDDLTQTKRQTGRVVTWSLVFFSLLAVLIITPISLVRCCGEPPSPQGDLCRDSLRGALRCRIPGLSKTLSDPEAVHFSSPLAVNLFGHGNGQLPFVHPRRLALLPQFEPVNGRLPPAS